jgi:hypothetical protein
MPAFDFDTHLAFRLVLYVHAASVALSALEYLSLRDAFADRGFYSWKVLRAAGASWRTPPGVARWQSKVYGGRGTSMLLWSRLLMAALIVALPYLSWSQWIALGVSALLTCLFSWRQKYGEDGADQMTLIVGITCFLTAGPWQGERVMSVGLWFLALQAVLAYLSAGVAKLVSPIWRDGSAVGLIVNTASYGSRGAGAIVARHHGLGRTGTWGTIAFEVSFLSVLFLPWPLVLVPIVAGAGFHLGIAAVMGLNNFVPAFLSTYPALLFASQVLSA